MNIVNDAIDNLLRRGGVVELQGCHYDLAVERIERMGFQPEESVNMDSWEVVFCRRPDGACFKVITQRLEGFTIIQFDPSGGSDT